MKKRFSSILAFVAVLALGGCAGMQRSCCSSFAQDFGADWVIVQVDMNGQPFRCWQLHDTSVANEAHSDGIYWLDKPSGNLVHISGLYNRVQVTNGKWTPAFSSLGLTKELCDKISHTTVKFVASTTSQPPASTAPSASSAPVEKPFVW